MCVSTSTGEMRVITGDFVRVCVSLVKLTKARTLLMLS